MPTRPDRATESASSDVVRLGAMFEGLSAQALLAEAIGRRFRDRIAVVSSFGADSAVLLHLVASIDRTVPVLFIDTGRHFAETIQHREVLARRRGQTADREGLPLVEADGPRVKINPLAAWSVADIETYVAAAGLPAHPLAAFGFRSIGCEPCTRAISPGEDPRAGRWASFAKTECGIHLPTPVSRDN